jgi:hypothetical protein
MAVLAIGTMTGKDPAPFLAAEKAWLDEKGRPSGLVRDAFLRTDRSGSIMVLEGTDAAGAAEALQDLPFLIEGVIAFEYTDIEIIPDD